MAELTTLARPYAKAAFEHAQAHQQLASWSAMLGLAAAVSQDDTMQRVLKAPRLTSADKAATFIEVCGDKFDVKVQNFIHVIAENDRLPLLPEIAALFDLYKAQGKAYGLPKVRLHLVGHSAGAILHSHLGTAAIAAGFDLRSVSLIAPAVRVDEFDRTLGKAVLKTLDGQDLTATLQRAMEHEGPLFRHHR